MIPNGDDRGGVVGGGGREGLRLRAKRTDAECGNK